VLAKGDGGQDLLDPIYRLLHMVFVLTRLVPVRADGHPGEGCAG
jgi:hypothetical protein